MSNYKPPYTLTNKAINLISSISESIGRLTAIHELEQNLKLRRLNRIKTIQGSLAIEGNTLTEHQITAVLDGKRVIAPPKEIQEARNAIQAYDRFDNWLPEKEEHLLNAHQIMMTGLLDKPGEFRVGGVGVMDGKEVIHVAPPAKQVPKLMQNLLVWLRACDEHPLIASSIFHYEFEFIHPFEDGNGRIGRLWQSLILYKWNPLFANIPVESLVHTHQKQYYQSIQQSTDQSDSAPFVEFILEMILNALNTSQLTPQVNVTPQVKSLLDILEGEMSREDIQVALGLDDRKSFRERYIKPALEAGLIEMTIPDKPNSRLQKYRKTSQ